MSYRNRTPKSLIHYQTGLTILLASTLLLSSSCKTPEEATQDEQQYILCSVKKLSMYRFHNDPTGGPRPRTGFEPTQVIQYAATKMPFPDRQSCEMTLKHLKPGGTIYSSINQLSKKEPTNEILFTLFISPYFADQNIQSYEDLSKQASAELLAGVKGEISTPFLYNGKQGFNTHLTKLMNLREADGFICKGVNTFKK